jgi:hypothetical protein
VSVHPFDNGPTLMKRVVVVPIEGILRKPVGGQVNPDGLYLFRTISAWYRVILTTFDTNRTWVQEWLDKEGIFKYDDILYGDLCINVTQGYWTNIIRILRTRGYNLDMVMVNGPAEALEVSANGVPVLMYTQPAYGLPEWLPDSGKGTEAWATLVGKIETERSARMTDRRMEEHLE